MDKSTPSTGEMELLTGERAASCELIRRSDILWTMMKKIYPEFCPEDENPFSKIMRQYME